MADNDALAMAAAKALLDARAAIHQYKLASQAAAAAGVTYDERRKAERTLKRQRKAQSRTNPNER